VIVEIRHVEVERHPPEALRAGVRAQAQSVDDLEILAVLMRPDQMR
jgi:hypothetical protein